jgi:hypothetical protein
MSYEFFLHYSQRRGYICPLFQVIGREGYLLPCGYLSISSDSLAAEINSLATSYLLKRICGIKHLARQVRCSVWE